MRLTDYFSEIIAFTLLLNQKLQWKGLSFEDISKKYASLIEKSRIAAIEGQFSLSDWQESLFAVCAWADETILCSEWPQKDRWQNNLLQKVYFNTTNAGEEFFEHLEGMLEDEQANQVRETYLMCLYLGFKGKYFMPSEKEQLSEIQKRHSEILQNERSTDSLKDVFMFPEAYPFSENKKHKKWRHIGILPVIISVIIVMSVFLIVLFFAYRGLLDEIVVNYLK